MDVVEALAALPETYAVALRLHLAGANAEAIGAQVHADPVSVPHLLGIAHAKLLVLLLEEPAVD